MSFVSTQPFVELLTVAISQGVKRPRLKANHPTTFNAQIKVQFPYIPFKHPQRKCYLLDPGDDGSSFLQKLVSVIGIRETDFVGNILSIYRSWSLIWERFSYEDEAKVDSSLRYLRFLTLEWPICIHLIWILSSYLTVNALCIGYKKNW
jgi:hypothetical protein